MIRIKKKTGTPKYKQIIASIEQAIISGSIKKGDQLPSLNSIKDTHKLSRDTVLMAFNELKTYLIQHHIYPSELWPDNSEDKFLLNIHIDFRYTKTDMEHIAQTLNNWTKSKTNQE